MRRSFVLILVLLAAAACAKREPPPAETEPRRSAPVPGPALAPPADEKPSEGESFDTPLGKLSSSGPSLEPATMTLAGKPFYPPVCAKGDAACVAVRENYETNDQIEVMGRYHPSHSNDLVVLFQTSMLGNACNGGSLFFIRFKTDGTTAYSELFSHCGGPDPKIVQEGDTVTISVRDHHPNRGTGIIKGYASTYDLTTNKLTELKNAKLATTH